MATIEQRGENAWRVYWRLGGRNGEKQSTTWETEDLAVDANKIAKAYRHQLTAQELYEAVLGPQPDDPAATSPTLTEWADSWLDSRTRISSGQRGRYRSQLDREILPFFEGKHLHEITATDVAKFVVHMQARVKHATVTRYFSCLHSVLKWAVTEEKIPRNPAARTDFERGGVDHDDASDDGDDHVYLTKREFQSIVDAAPQWARPVLWLLVWTGTRWSEATAVPISAVRRGDKPRVRVHRAWKQYADGKWYLGATKGRNRRSVELPPLLLAMLAPLMDGQAGDTLLLRTPRGKRVGYSNFRTRVWNPAVAAAMRCDHHMPLLADGSVDTDPLAVSSCECPTRLRARPTIHDLRHTYTAWLIDAGKPITVISRSLGHRDTATTEKTYAGIMPEASEGLATALNDMFTEPVPASRVRHAPTRRHVLHRQRRVVRPAS